MEQISQSTITKFFKSPNKEKTNILIDFVEKQPEKAKMDFELRARAKAAKSRV